MQRLLAIALGSFAVLALAGTPALAVANVTTTAHALHTGVQPRAHVHRAHGHHAHHGGAELRVTVNSRRSSRQPWSVPAAPHRRPARPHALLPHAGLELHRSSPRGSAPYALGQASLSLGLWTTGESIPINRNELISDPLSGVLRGRSPPRGIPLRATPCPCIARPLNSASPPRASAAPPRDCRTTPAPLAEPTSQHRCFEARLYPGAFASVSIALHAIPDPDLEPVSLAGHAVPTDRASRRREPAFPNTPDRASEGRTAGSPLPSRRSFA